jgi:hypothetical protein
VPDSRRAYAWHLMAMMVIRGAAACAVFKIDFAYAGPQSLRNAITRFDQVGLQEGWNLAKQVRDAIEELVTIFSGNPCRNPERASLFRRITGRYLQFEADATGPAARASASLGLALPEFLVAEQEGSPPASMIVMVRSRSSLRGLLARVVSPGRTK